MARLTFSPLIAGIRGKAADAVFSIWKGRPYVRQHVIPANPQTVAQTAIRTALAECVSIWQNLLDAIKTGYGNGAAALSISGYNDLIKLNRAALQAETGLFGPRRDNTVASPRIQIPTDCAYNDEPVAGSFSVDWTDPGQGADYLFGGMVYDSTAHVITHQYASVGAMSGEAMTFDGCTIGNVYLCAMWVYRTTDEQFVHMGSIAHTQLS